jgi:hypothetical protein
MVSTQMQKMMMEQKNKTGMMMGPMMGMGPMMMMDPNQMQKMMMEHMKDPKHLQMMMEQMNKTGMMMGKTNK